MPRQATTPTLKIDQFIVETEVIHPCALVNAGVPGDVRGWNTNLCARYISSDDQASTSPDTSSPSASSPVTAGIDEVGLIPFLIVFIALL